MKKITLATFKSFIRKNRAALLVRVTSEFDGQIDGLRYSQDKSFSPALASDRPDMIEHDLGVHAVYLVGGGRDYFTAFSENGYEGITFSNSCGCGAVAIRSESEAPAAPVEEVAAPVVEKAPALPIGKIREAIRAGWWLRDWMTGGTSDETLRQNVGPELRQRAAELEALEIPARFAAEIVRRDEEVQSLRNVAARWEARRIAAGMPIANDGPRPQEIPAKLAPVAAIVAAVTSEVEKRPAFAPLRLVEFTPERKKEVARAAVAEISAHLRACGVEVTAPAPAFNVAAYLVEV